MQRKRSGLGRGLDALITSSEGFFTGQGVIEVSIESILRNPRQPRNQFNDQELQELAISIKEFGVLQPLIVSRESDSEKYVLIAGERRLLGAQIAGLKSVPVIIREATEQQLIELALIENIQRSDLNPLESADAYHQLADEFGLSHEEIAAKVGKSRTSITNAIRLLKLPTEIQQALIDEKITEGHARALLALSTSESQKACLQIVLNQSLNVRQTEQLVRKYLGHNPPAAEVKTPNPQAKAIEDRLRSFLGTKVRLHYGRSGGSITIHYYSDEELDNILEMILGEDHLNE